MEGEMINMKPNEPIGKTLTQLLKDMEVVIDKYDLRDLKLTSPMYDEFLNKIDLYLMLRHSHCFQIWAQQELDGMYYRA